MARSAAAENREGGMLSRRLVPVNAPDGKVRGERRMEADSTGSAATPADVIVARPVLRPFAPPGAGGLPVEPLRLEGVSRRDAALDLALVLLVLLVLPMGLDLVNVVSLAGEDPGELGGGTLQQRFLTNRKVFDALLAATLAGYFVWRHRISAAAFGLHGRAPLRQVLLTVPILLATYATFMVSVVVTTLLVTGGHDLQQEVETRREFMQLMPLDNLWSGMALMAPVAIHEELLFRGLMLPYLRRLGCSWTWAVVLSSGLFAALHLAQGWLGVVQLLPVGIVLAVAFIRTRSLAAVVLAHFAFNVLQLQLARVVLPLADRLGG